MTALPELASLIDLATAHLAGAHPDDLQAARARLFAVLDRPDQGTWDAASGILVRPGLTLWQAAVRHGGYAVLGRRVGEPWPAIPTVPQLVNALRMCAPAATRIR